MSDDDETKPAKKRPKGDYAVGYAKTPDHSKFKPGNEIGKRGGRPKGRKNNATLIREILEFKIDMTLPGGTSRRVPLLHAATWKLAMKALGGDARAYAEIKQLAEQVGIVVSEPPPADEELSPDEAATLEIFLASVAAEADLNRTLLPKPVSAEKGVPGTVIRFPDRPTVRRVTFGTSRSGHGTEGTAP